MDNPTGAEEQKGPVTLPVENRDMDQVPISGCDHTYVTVLPTDESLVLQMFSTVPPLLDAEDGKNMPKVVVRKCIGQFHFTLKGAHILTNMLQEALKNVDKGRSA